MSFSSDVKNEIIKSCESGKKLRICQILGMICFGAKLVGTSDGFRFRFQSENPKISRLLYTVLKNDMKLDAGIRIHKSVKNAAYHVVVENEEHIRRLFRYVGLIGPADELGSFINYKINSQLVKTSNEKKAFLKGAFLAGGSVTTPQKNFHLEFATTHYRLSTDFEKLLESLSMSPRTVMRKSSYVVYFKSGEEIADILTVLGAYDSVMEYHNIKIIKEMRNSINRKMNCETANMTKTIDASMAQVKAIEKLEKLGILSQLSEQLREIAHLRLEHRELSLQELGSMLSSPIGKSGVNHRLRKLVEEAEKYE